MLSTNSERNYYEESEICCKTSWVNREKQARKISLYPHAFFLSITCNPNQASIFEETESQSQVLPG